MRQPVIAGDDSKAFDTLVAQFALAGQELHLYAAHRGLSTPLANLDAARAYLAQIDGSSP